MCVWGTGGGVRGDYRDGFHGKRPFYAPSAKIAPSWLRYFLLLVIPHLVCFLFLQKLVGDDQLHIVEQPALAPPEVTIDLAYQKQFKNEMEKAKNMPLPEDDDGF